MYEGLQGMVSSAICERIYGRVTPVCEQEKSLQSCEHHVDDDLLEGHLNVTRELVAMQSTNRLFQLGTQPGGAQLIKVICSEHVCAWCILMFTLMHISN